MSSSETNRLRQRLEESGLRVKGIFPGTEPATPEQVAGAINRVLDQLEAGDFEEVDDAD